MQYNDEQLTISTPEQVAFHYEMAGIGSRFVASMLDHLIMFLALFIVNFALFYIFINGVISSGDSSAGYIMLAFMTLVSFAIFWGYFALFETIWNGQTPGKRAGRLRVIRRDGQPVRAGEVMIRNLVRLVDFLPSFYGIGLITMFINKDGLRLGDLAAGTIVVREGEQTNLRDVRVAPRAQTSVPAESNLPYGAAAPASYSPYMPQPQPTNTESYGYTQPSTPRYDPLPGISLREVTNDDYRLIREMVARWSRGEMSRERAYELSHRLASGVASRMGQDFNEWQRRGWEPITFLQSILTAKEARE